MTKDEILEFVKKAGLKPADIVAKSNGLIPITQAYDWLRTWKFSMSTLLLLEVYAKKEGVAEIFSEKVRGQYRSTVVEFEPAKVEMSQGFYSPEAVLSTIKGKKTAPQKIPAKKPLNLPITTVSDHGAPKPQREVRLTPFAANTMDDPMIRRLRSDKGANYWVLYCKRNKYRLELADIGCSIVTEEGTFVLSDFTKK